jgi:hypothetical protein
MVGSPNLTSRKEVIKAYGGTIFEADLKALLAPRAALFALFPPRRPFPSAES